jgi:hypothetical protein
MSIEDIAELEPDPLEIDSRPCEWCGLPIDQHRMVDIGEGPEFFCNEFEYQIQLEAAARVQRWDLADTRDRWRHTGEPPPKASDVPNARPEPYRTNASTVDAFLFVARQGDRPRLARWLADHPADKAELFKLWKAERSC